MIGSLRGKIIDQDASQLLLDVGGVGYRIEVTPATSGALHRSDDEVFVWVHHHIREGAQTLFGFTSREERDIFEIMIATHGVGPSLGIAILSVHAPRDLRLALATDDLAALCLVPGVGKKTAQRLLVELKGKLELGDIDLTATGDLVAPAEAPAIGSDSMSDVRVALAGLGYSGEEINSAVAGLPDDEDVSELLRLALRSLAGAK